MESNTDNRIFKIAHSYHPDPNVEFEIIKVYVYRSSIILTGYSSGSKSFSSFIHLEFKNLNLKNIYSTQLQLAYEVIPQSYKKADTVLVYHTESYSLILSQEDLPKVNAYKSFTSTYPEFSEKVLTSRIESLGLVEYYSYPYRVFNDVRNYFETAEFNSYHIKALPKLVSVSNSNPLIYISDKSDIVELILIKDNNLISIETIEKAENNVKSSILSIIKSNDFDINTEVIFTGISNISSSLKSELENEFNNFNKDIKGKFRIDDKFWCQYGDIVLCI